MLKWCEVHFPKIKLKQISLLVHIESNAYRYAIFICKVCFCQRFAILSWHTLHESDTSHPSILHVRYLHGLESYRWVCG